MRSDQPASVNHGTALSPAAKAHRQRVGRPLKLAVTAALGVTASCVILWQTTGGDYYTKYSVVEEVRVPVDPNDPLAAAGFYDDRTETRTRNRKEFRFGLLPAPEGIFDKHVISVTTVSGPLWLGIGGLLWWSRRNKKRKQQSRSLKTTPARA